MSSGSITSTPPASTTNVLVVEDEMVLRMRAVDIVEDAGFTAVKLSTLMKPSPFSNRAQTSHCCFPTFKCPAAWTA